MNGPQHYREAERLIATARGDHHDQYADTPAITARLAEAQVHATLALAAATVQTTYTGHGPDGDYTYANDGTGDNTWASVAGDPT